MQPGYLRQPGAILLLSCYELGHQPQGLAWPAAFLERAGFSPRMVDLPVQGLDEASVAQARFVGISVPMHTALRLGARAGRRIRQINRDCSICFYGLYASLNAGYLLDTLSDYVVGGEYEEALVGLVEALDGGSEVAPSGVARRGAPAAGFLGRLRFPPPLRSGLAPLG
ncbi:MAG: radical SAM protein, partial [Acidobacteria bacterium]